MHSASSLFQLRARSAATIARLAQHRRVPASIALVLELEARASTQLEQEFAISQRLTVNFWEAPMPDALTRLGLIAATLTTLCDRILCPSQSGEPGSGMTLMSAWIVSDGLEAVLASHRVDMLEEQMTGARPFWYPNSTVTSLQSVVFDEPVAAALDVLRFMILSAASPDEAV